MNKPTELQKAFFPATAMPDKTVLAQAVWRVLKAGGRFAIVNWHQVAREQTTVPECPRKKKRISRRK